MNKISVCLVALALSLSLSAQEKVGAYHSTYYQEDFDVVIDNLKARFYGYQPRKSEKPQIYFEVKCEEDDVRAFIMLNLYSIKSFKSSLDKLGTRFAEWSEKSPLSEQLVVDDVDVNLFFIRTRPSGRVDIGFESGLDYEVFFARDENDTPILADNITEHKNRIYKFVLYGTEKEISKVQDRGGSVFVTRRVSRGAEPQTWRDDGRHCPVA